MNDNHNPADTPLHITMDEPTQAQTQTPEAEHHVPPALVNVLLAAFEKHIDMLVETKFAQLVQNHKTLALMDENMKDAITEMIDDAIETALDGHTDDYTHHSEGDIESTVSDHFDYLIRQGSHELVTTRELSEKVGDVLDEILSDRINDALSGASIEITV